jgi:DNA-binding Lrp family transcriptional regulator
MIMFEAWCNCKGTGVVPALAGDEVIYAICDFCDGAGVIQIKGEDMEESNSNPQISQEYFDDKGKPFTYEEYVELKKTYQEVRDKVWEQREELRKTRELVRNWFQELYEDSDYSDDFNVEVGDINTLLRDIKALELSKVYEATASIELTIKVHAESKDDAETIITEHLSSIDFSSYEDGDDYELQSVDVYVND